MIWLYVCIWTDVDFNVTWEYSLLRRFRIWFSHLNVNAECCLWKKWETMIRKCLVSGKDYWRFLCPDPSMYITEHKSENVKFLYIRFRLETDRLAPQPSSSCCVYPFRDLVLHQSLHLIWSIVACLIGLCDCHLV